MCAGMNTQSAKGVTLIHVMMLMALLGAILVSEIQKRQSFSDTQAFYYTVAQTQMALNNAFGEFNASGNWPSNAGDCAIDPPVLNNGWGTPVHCVYEPAGADPGDADAYRVIQYLPPHLGELFEDEFADDGAASASAIAGYTPPPDFVAYSVRVDRSGGAEQRVDFTVLSGVAGSPASVEEIDCPDSTKPNPRAFVSLGGMETYVNYNEPVDYPQPPLFLCIPLLPPFTLPSVNVDPPDARLGFRLLSNSPSPDQIEITYNMYRRRYNLTVGAIPPLPLIVDGYDIFDPSNVIVEIAATSEWSCDSYSTTDEYDGNANAQYQVNGEPIRMSVFQYCSP